MVVSFELGRLAVVNREGGECARARETGMQTADYCKVLKEGHKPLVLCAREKPEPPPRSAHSHPNQ